MREGDAADAPEFLDRLRAGDARARYQTKQLSLISASEVPVDKHFICYGAADYYRT